MTTYPFEAAPNANDPARALLADAATRRRLGALVRRRVAREDADDIVQAVLCEALAAERIPADPDELARWLAGVAKHEVADHHRRRARRPAPAAGVDPEALAGRAAPIDARSLLAAVAADAGKDARGAQALEWVVREAQGERLDEMAREAKLEPATVRQRVSRLRRLLQRRWLREALLVAAAMGALFAVHAAWAPGEGAPIVAEPAGGREGEILAALQGEWRVEQVDAADAEPKRALAARAARVVVEGDRVVIAWPLGHVERRLRIESAREDGFDVALVDEHGGAVRVSARFDGEGRVLVASPEAGWAGRVALAR